MGDLPNTWFPVHLVALVTQSRSEYKENQIFSTNHAKTLGHAPLEREGDILGAGYLIQTHLSHFSPLEPRRYSQVLATPIPKLPNKIESHSKRLNVTMIHG
jgi:hypothetical protein